MAFEFLEISSAEFKKIRREINLGKHGFSDTGDNARDTRLSEARDLLQFMDVPSDGRCYIAKKNRQVVAIAVTWPDKLNGKPSNYLDSLIGNGSGGATFLMKQLIQLSEKEKIPLVLQPLDSATLFYKQFKELKTTPKGSLYYMPTSVASKSNSIKNPVRRIAYKSYAVASSVYSHKQELTSNDILD